MYDPTLFSDRQSVPSTPRTRAHSLSQFPRADTDKVCPVHDPSLTSVMLGSAIPCSGTKFASTCRLVLTNAAAAIVGRVNM